MSLFSRVELPGASESWEALGWRMLVGGRGHSLESWFGRRPEAYGSVEVHSARQNKALMLEQWEPSKHFRHWNDVLKFIVTC